MQGFYLMLGDNNIIKTFSIHFYRLFIDTVIRFCRDF